MGFSRTLRIIGITIILSLLMAFALASSVQAARSIKLDTASGRVGDKITITGSGFSASTASTDKYVDIYLTVNGNNTSYYIGNQVKTYEKVKAGVWIDQAGNIKTTFNIPSVLDDGSSDKKVEVGTTYYICATREYTSYTNPAVLIQAYAMFTVTSGEISLNPKKGPVDTLVKITGSKFITKKEITIKYDGNKIKIEDGDSKTDSNGKFASIICIPPSTAGIHTITASVDSSEVTAEFTVESDIVLSKQSGEAGTEVTASGTGFGRRKEVEIWFNDNIGVATATTSSTGSFTTKFNVPTGLGPGIKNVDAEDGSNTARTKFTVISPPPPTTIPPIAPTLPHTSLSVSQSTGNIGTSLTLSGAGFKPNGTVTIKYDDKIIATATADASGIFTATFKVPPSKHGSHTITASDGTSAKEITFAVESVAPKTPPPLLPGMGVKVKSPISFDWKDVTDESSPVTYVLQIATDKDFKAGSILLEKTELAESEYILTEKEEPKLAGKRTPYYWRVRAIDAALNEGEWTSVSQFYVAVPFALPSWALYTIIGVAAVLIFAIGYWIGRRTAFYH
ncbi:MAG: Ig-like domain-containing protein [Chloroflexi bacterium]|nr:Ig-like domain-containing protein [Chloroflexota bacterium]